MVGALALIDGVVGGTSTITLIGSDFVEHTPFDTVTVYEPTLDTVID